MSICGEAQLERCLAALEQQREGLEFDVVVAAAPTLGDLAQVRQRFPRVQIIVNEDVTSPIQLAASAVTAADGELILLTEDHCVPDSGWVAALSRGLGEGRGAVGGIVDPLDEGTMSPFDWAFYYVDFFRYQAPQRRGAVHSLSSCNVGYRKTDLESLEGWWRGSFHETRVHAALTKRVGPLWMEPDARVEAGRKVLRGDALRERFAFGRIYACRRIDKPNGAMRLWRALASPLLPLLLLARLASAARRDTATARRFRRSLPDLALLVLAWSAGETLGYWTGQAPANANAAPERSPAE